MNRPRTEPADQPTAAARFDHVLEVDADGATAVEHPDTCRPRQRLCPVSNRIREAAAAALPPGRYALGINDLADRLLIGDRVRSRRAGTPAVDPLAVFRAALGRNARLGVRPIIGQAEALTLLYAAVAGDYSPLGRIVRDLALLHTNLPGTGNPWPNCPHCKGAGYTPADGDIGPRHCHCRCDLCKCGDPLCDGPCHHVAVLLDALVLNGTPAGAVDLPAALARLRFAAVERIAAGEAGQDGAAVAAVDGQPDAALVTVGDHSAAERIEDALYREGYRCERRPVAEPSTSVTLHVVSSY